MRQASTFSTPLPDEAAGCSTAPGKLVLDTNVVLDLLVFEDPRTQGLARALEARHIVWLASAHMRNEFEAIIARPSLARQRVDARAALLAFDARAKMLPPPDAASRVLRCRDPADQCFIDFALGHRAQWLLSHDRDLLSLARQAGRWGLAIGSPQAWAASRAA